MESYSLFPKEVISLLEAVALIGRTLAMADDPLADLVKKPPRKASKVDTIYLVKLDFRTGSAAPLAVEMQEIDEAVLSRCCWIGNNVGSRPQFYLTTDQLQYLVGQAPGNLLARLEEAGLENGGLYRRVSALVGAFFRKLPDGSRVLDPRRIGAATEDLLSAAWEESAGKPRDRAKAAVTAAAEAVKKWALGQLGLKTAEAALWTVLYDGEPLVRDPDYAAVVLRDKEGAVNQGEQGVCSICGAADRPVAWDFAQLNFLKYYITDKLSAASGLVEEGFTRNFQACKDCFQGLLRAESFAQQNLNLKVGPLSFLVLPAFLQDVGLTRADLDAWAQRLQARIGVLANAAQWVEKIGGRGGLESELLNFLEDLALPFDNAALLNFLFYRKSKSEFRVLALVKDVAPSRITGLVEHSHRLASRAAALLGPDRQGGWWLDLTAIYRLVPLSEGPRGAEYKKLLHIYTGLLTGAPLDRAFLIREFVALAKIYHTGNYPGTNVRPKAGNEEWEWTRRLMQANLFLQFLREEKLLRGGSFLSEPLEIRDLPEDIREYLQAMAYSEEESALFLLGYLLNQVGRAQAGSGYEHKPVLEKVNYNGMTWGKVVRLANILVDQLRQHDIFRYNEGLFAVMKKLFDARRHNWSLSPEENVFYILSGYAYATRAAIKAWAEKQNDTKGGSE